MSRRRKALILVLVPTLVLTAYAAAQALGAKFTAGKYVATVTGTSTNTSVFKVASGAREISCTGTAVNGSLSAASETLSVSGEGSPSLCKSNGLALPVTGTTNGCTVTATITSFGGTTGSASTAIDCPAGKELEMRVYENATKHGEAIAFCEYGVPAQGSLKTIETHNSGSGSSEEIIATVSVSEIKVNVLKGTLLACGAAAGKSTTATYTSNFTAIATEEAGSQTALMVG